MGLYTTKDGVDIYYEDWGTGPPVVKSVKLVSNATLKIYPGAPHGLTGAHEQEFDADLLAFLAGRPVASATAQGSSE